MAKRPKIYDPDKNVLQAAQERLAKVFDMFEVVCISLSGGKDSTALFHLAYEEAQRRGVPLHVLIIDLEGQYRVTIEHLMDLCSRPGLEVYWVCLPLNLRNGCSLFDPHWCCWEPDFEAGWVRQLPEHSGVINDQEYFDFYEYRMEFEHFIDEFPKWLAEKHGQPIAQLVGIRADESTNRFNAVKPKNGVKKSAYQNINWSVESKDGNVSFFPIYDWRFEDIWAYFGKTGHSHNKLYDWMYLAGIPNKDMRICQPYGDDQRKGLEVWHSLEPETWPKIVARVSGANYGAMYANGKLMGYRRKSQLPEGHSWKSYTFFLLSTLPDAIRERIISNYAVFLEWWLRNGLDSIDLMVDAQEDQTLETKKIAPSWRRLAMVILKNDFNCKSLSIGMVKYVHADVYNRVRVGKPVKVRKSVKPVYASLRGEYQNYLDGGMDAVTLELPTPEPNPIKEKYAEL